MMDGIGDAIAYSMMMTIVFAFLAGGAFFAFIFFGIPWLWRLIKPWLHTITG